MVSIERLTAYNAQDAAQIGKLLPVLSDKFSDAPVNESLLREIIDSPHHEQFVARLDGRIVGTATVSITIGTGAGRKAYLEDFVVDPNVQGEGIGSSLWNEIISWCREKGVTLFFTSNPKREAAQRFYLKNGATIRDTNVFKYDPTD